MVSIHPIKALKDNYIWVLRPNPIEKDVYVFDPGNEEPVLSYLKDNDLNLAGILLTHHHHDHVNGAVPLSAHFQIPIWGPQSSKMLMVTHSVGHNDNLQIGHLQLRVFALPGHTKDHICYYLEEPELSVNHLFSADTLFSMGCGRIFDSTPETLFQSLEFIKRLPSNTLIYATHEYTLANIRFCLSLFPEDSEFLSLAAQLIELEAQNLPSLPVRLEEEKKRNPFLRCDVPEIKNKIAQITGKSLTTPESAFVALRLLKNQF